GSVEAVVQLETIEHVPEPEAAASEAARVLAPGGVYVVSTPNRLHTAKDDQGRPSDPFHLRELDPDELLELLAPRFGSVQLYGQNRISAVRHQRRRLRGMVQRVVGFAAIERVRSWRDGVLGPLLVRRPSALADAQQQARMVATNVSGLREYLYMLAVATK
ncbi:MAG: methyltransferase domain-containing protein, partial [Armatimonadetes bacterium]|nr:methyltransferase domain-containing protein [Armatimonadota bacterium]